MTLIEAIKSGKRFRRLGEKEYWDRKEISDMYFVVDEVLSDDWEVEPDAPKYTVAECFLALSNPSPREFGCCIISDELRLSIVYHLKSINDFTLPSSVEKDEPKSTSMGVEKY